MMRDRWRDIRAMIETDIRDGVLEPGARLPTEPELVEIYGVGRHSVRRAVAELAKEGLLSIEQGRGTFVQACPMIDYSIGKRTRLRRNLGPQGLDASSRFIGAERIAAKGRVAELLGLAEGAPVVATQRLSCANGVPVSFGTLFHDANRFPDFPERRQVTGSTTEVYRSYGIEDYVRGETRIHARQARGDEARLLHQHPDMPVLVVRAVDTTLDGEPIAHSKVIWSAARVTFSIRQEEDA